MKEIILIKNGELALKGLNRSSFESTLIKNIKYRLHDLGKLKIVRSQSTVTIEPQNDGYDFEEACDRIGKVFGLAAYSRAAVAPKDIDKITEIALEYLKPQLENAETFKVEAKRSDKSFPLKSPEICKILGGEILKRFHHLKVDVHNPEKTVVVEIRDVSAYIRCGQIKGAGGMPVGTAGKAEVLISGGIDSPVASWMMARRGLKLDAVHFASPPYTSLRAEMKVKKLLQKVAKYSGGINLAVVPFTEIQEQIAEKCPEEYFTLIMRRFMMRIAEKIAQKNNCGCLITGESLGQVASQTLPALNTTNAVVSTPVFRPLIGMDKEDIIEISRKIDTFETSIEPYEDCCTVFTPKHPRTRPTVEQCIEAEKNMDIDALIQKAIEGTVFSIIS